MRRGTRWAWGLLVLAVLSAGCKLKRVEDEKSINLAVKDVQEVMEIPAQPKEMDVSVTATTTPPTPVTLYLVLKEDSQDVMLDLEAGKDSSKILAKSASGETPALEGKAPANKDCSVVAANGGQKTEVKAKIVGRY